MNVKERYGKVAQDPTPWHKLYVTDAEQGSLACSGWSKGWR